jgi:hypothetical protein
MIITSLDVYHGGFVVHYKIKTAQDPLDPMMLGWHMGGIGSPDFFLRATDDRGTEYRGMPRGGGGGGDEWQGSAQFSPAIPNQATVLTLRVDELVWESSGPGRKSRVQLGPWEFTVGL